MPCGKPARWIAANGTRGPVATPAPWRRGGRGEDPVDETRDLVVDGRVIDPNQIDIWEAADELDAEAQHCDDVNDAD